MTRATVVKEWEQKICPSPSTYTRSKLSKVFENTQLEIVKQAQQNFQKSVFFEVICISSDIFKNTLVLESCTSWCYFFFFSKILKRHLVPSETTDFHVQTLLILWL